jgi:YhcH/YjgK/YiaL family protein
MMRKITNYDDLLKYFDLPSGTLDFVKTINRETKNGDYYFGDLCFVKVMDIELDKPNGELEAHDVYVDAQCLFTDSERIYYRNRQGLSVTKPYNEKNDIVFFKYEESPYVDYKAGECVLFYPEDAHMPGSSIGGAAVAKKAVIKINKKLIK